MTYVNVERRGAPAHLEVEALHDLKECRLEHVGRRQEERALLQLLRCQ